MTLSESGGMRKNNRNNLQGYNLYPCKILIKGEKYNEKRNSRSY